MAKGKNKKNTNHIDSVNISQNKEDTHKEKIEDPIPNEDVTSDEESITEEGIASEEDSNTDEGLTSDTELGVDFDAIKRKKRRKLIIRSLRILFTIGFFVFVALFINETLIQPYKLKKSIDRARDLYHYEEEALPTKEPDKALDDSEDKQIANSDIDPLDIVTPTPTPDPNRDDMGRLKKFANLLEVNEDVKGWIRIDNINGENDTKIDYVVVQSDISDPEYYLDKRWDTHEYLKAGSIFLDSTSSLERNSKNLVIHGHNMTSSDDMFHYLLNYNEVDYLKEHPIISFDTIYEEAMWKIFSVYITPGTNQRDDFFPYVKSSFASKKDFIEYIYQIRLRSLFDMDDIDINEDDQILSLSTCSYELSNYRTIIVARKVRENEDPSVNTDGFEKRDKEDVLYAPSYYWRYGGKAPKVPSFEEALQDGLMPWYNPMSR
jgi:sortase B